MTRKKRRFKLCRDSLMRAYGTDIPRKKEVPGSRTIFPPERYSEMEQEIFNEIVERRGSVNIIKDKYAPIIEPYREERYPIQRMGTLTRVPRKYMNNWFNLGKLIERLEAEMNNKDYRHMRYGEKVKATFEALCKVGTDNYTEEWTDEATQRQLDDMIEQSTGMPVAANQLNAENFETLIREDIKAGRDVSNIVIVDIGPGLTASTITPILEKIDRLSNKHQELRDYHKKMTVILYDVQDLALDLTKARITKRIDDADIDSKFKKYIKPSHKHKEMANVLKIRDNFQNIMQHADRAEFQNGPIYLTSGAAIMHNSDVFRFFRDVRRLMEKKGGAIVCWDWNGGPSWAAPNLRLGDERKTVFYQIDMTGPKKLFEFKDGWMPKAGHIRRMRDMFVETVYQTSERGAVIAEANFQTWLGLQGYIETDSETGRTLERRINGIPISEYLHNVFWRNVTTARGFNYVDDFLRKIVEHCVHPLTERTAYHMIEGYGYKYADILEKLMFHDICNISFERMERLYGVKIERYYSRGSAPTSSHAEKLLQFTTARYAPRSEISVSAGE